MTGAVASAAVGSADGGPSLYERKSPRRNLASRRDQPRLTAEQAARQGAAVTFALKVFTSPSDAMAFLNGDHPNVGRPLDLAVASDAGLMAVEAAAKACAAEGIAA